MPYLSEHNSRPLLEMSPEKPLCSRLYEVASTPLNAQACFVENFFHLYGVERLIDFSRVGELDIRLLSY